MVGKDNDYAHAPIYKPAKVSVAIKSIENRHAQYCN